MFAGKTLGDKEQSVVDCFMSVIDCSSSDTDCSQCVTDCFSSVSDRSQSVIDKEQSVHRPLLVCDRPLLIRHRPLPVSHGQGAIRGRLLLVCDRLLPIHHGLLPVSHGQEAVNDRLLLVRGQVSRFLDRTADKNETQGRQGKSWAGLPLPQCMLETTEQAGFVFTRKLVLPDAEDPPPGRPQDPGHELVAGLVAGDFFTPEGGVAPGCVPCRGQPCQKQPSTKSAERDLRKTKSDEP